MGEAAESYTSILENVGSGCFPLPEMLDKNGIKSEAIFRSLQLMFFSLQNIYREIAFIILRVIL